MDFSIPSNSPKELEMALESLISDFQQGYLTQKGYTSKRNALLATFNQIPTLEEINVEEYSPSMPETSILDRESTKYSIAITDDFHKSKTDEITTHHSTNDGIHYEENDFSNAMVENEIIRDFQKPLDPRDIVLPKSNDQLDSLAMILRKRATMYERQPVVLVLDEKGRETKPLTWDKLYFKAEKIAKQIKSKAALYPGDRVCLIYQNFEVADFMVALFGCFLSGTVAVPLNSSTPVKDLVTMMEGTQTHLCLMSDSVFKHFEKKQKMEKQSFWPKGMNIWKTTDMGTYKPSRKDGNPPLKITDLAYIDYTKSTSGEWKGVVISHRTIINQMRMVSTILSTSPDIQTPVVRPTNKQSRVRNSMLSTLDCRGSIGMITSILYSVFSGNLLVWLHPKTAEIPGLYANMISTYRISILLSDYDILKTIAYNYQSFPQSTRTFSKKKVDLSSVSWCLIDSPTVDCEFNDVLSDRWFKPLGHPNSRSIISPILSLPEHGGTIISMRDWYGHEDRLGCTFQENKINRTVDDDGFDDEEDDDDEFEFEDNADKLSEVFIDKASLTTNSVVVIHDSSLKNLSLDPTVNSKYVRVGAFGFPVPDATLALVNPETKVLSGVMEVGEIWVDSHCISGGYWGLPEQTQDVFQAECEDFQGVLSIRFVRTGLLGFTYNGKVYVLGLYEDRINQRITWFDQYNELKKEKEEFNNNENKTNNIDLSQPMTNKFIYRYHFSSHLGKTLQKYLPDVKASAFFNLIANKEYLVFSVVEIDLKTDDDLNSRKNKLKFYSLCQEIFKLLEKYHNLKPFNILITRKGSLSRSLTSGRFEIANSLTKRKFIEGRLPCLYTEFNPYKGTGVLYHNEDYEGGVWSPYSSSIRQELLNYANFQNSGLDWREFTFDIRTEVNLNEFKTPYDLLKFRANKQTDELAFAQIEGPIIKENKQLTTWKKFENSVFSTCSYILEKKLMKSGYHVILLYPLCEDLLISLQACWMAGFIPIVLPTFSKDLKSLDEDIESFINIVKKFKIQGIFVNNETEQSIKNKPVSSKLKLASSAKGITIPKTRNTTKHSKTSSNGKQTYKVMEKYRLQQAQVKKPNYDLIWIDWDDDYKYKSTYLKFENLMKMCFTIKETCQMTKTSPLLASGKYTSGLGYIQASLLGIYLGVTTYFMTPIEFGTYPNLYFQTLSRYKIENVYITGKMLKHSIKKNGPNKIDLSNLKNLMIGWESCRAEGKIIEVFNERFESCNIPNGSISNIYGDIKIPLISTRSYLNFDCVKLWLDPYGLSRGYISLVNPTDSPNAISVVDSGVVVVNTEVIIVNPETHEQCRIGEYGEIWVSSESNIIQSGGENLTKFKGGEYYQTGEFGFLHPIKKQQPQNNVNISNNKSIEIELLYNLGPIDGTFEVAGLQFFVNDIENCVEEFFGVQRCMVFKFDGLVVLLISIDTSKTLSNVTSLITIKVLNKFKLGLDIISFLPLDSLPVSRIGLLQRGKILERWVNGKLPLIDTFGVGTGESDLIKNIENIEWVNEEIRKR